MFDDLKDIGPSMRNEDSFFKMGYSATAELLASDSSIEALFYHSDYFALGGSKFLLEKGIVIGKDILLAGFNNTMAVRAYPFPISSVEHDVNRITQAMIEESFNDTPITLTIKPIIHIRK